MDGMVEFCSMLNSLLTLSRVGGTTGYLPSELDDFITLWLQFWVMNAF